jgi:hypothetical protein
MTTTQVAIALGVKYQKARDMMLSRQLGAVRLEQERPYVTRKAVEEYLKLNATKYAKG